MKEEIAVGDAKISINAISSISLKPNHILIGIRILGTTISLPVTPIIVCFK